MPNFYFTLPDSVTLPADGNKVMLTAACELHRDDGATPNTLSVAEGRYNVFLADVPGTGSALAPASVPAQMSAPVVNSSGANSIAVDRAAAPADGGSAIASYDLRWRPSGGAWTTITGISDPDAVTGLSEGTLYSVQTRAVNGVGNGPWSLSGSATTDAMPSGPLFADDFTGYALNSDLKDSNNYTNVEGFLYIEAQDDNGTRVARQPSGTQSETLVYTGQAVSARRKVSWTLYNNRLGVAGSGVKFYAAYTDSSNYISAAIDANGWVQVTHTSDGATNLSYSVPPGILEDGNTISIEIDNTIMTVQVDSVDIRPPDRIPELALGPPGFRLSNNTAATISPAISNFFVEEL